MSRIDITEIDRKIPALISRLEKRHGEKIALKLKEWPGRFLNRAIRFYPSVLKRPTGRLIRSFSTLTRRLGKKVAQFGLRAGSESDPIEYARPLHDGFTGSVNIPAHRVKSHSIRAHSRSTTYGPVSVRSHTRKAHVRGAHTRQLNIRARYFFSTPMRALIPKLMKDLKNLDKWEK